MFNQDELTLMRAPGLERFPLIKAAASLYNGCNSCNKHRANPKSALIMAINRYKNDTAFLNKVKTLFGHPVYLGGHLIGE